MVSFGLPRHFYLGLYYCLALFIFLLFAFCGKILTVLKYLLKDCWAEMLFSRGLTVLFRKKVGAVCCFMQRVDAGNRKAILVLVLLQGPVGVALAKKVLARGAMSRWWFHLSSSICRWQSCAGVPFFPLLVIKGFHPSCGLMLWDDFNPLNISCLASQLKPKQLIDKAMQGDKTLQTLLVCMTRTLWRFYLWLVYLTIMWLFFVLKPTYPPLSS